MDIPTYQSGLLQVKAYRILQLNISQSLAKYGINPTEWSVIGLIYESKNGIQLSEIADLLSVDRPLITIVIDNLEEKKLVERHDHPKDKRSKLLFLTKKGKSTVPQIEELLRTVLFNLLKNVTPEDLQAYKRVLEAIISNNTLV